jgi:hypothetical protein
MERVADLATVAYQQALSINLDPKTFVVAVVDMKDHRIREACRSVLQGAESELSAEDGYAVAIVDDATALSLASSTSEAAMHLKSARNGLMCRILVGTAGGWLAADLEHVRLAPN